MADVNHTVTLSGDQLNDIDTWILDYMSECKRATPSLLRKLYNEDMAEDDEDMVEGVSRQWVSQRVTRLAEHGHLQRVHPDDSVYEFVSDPRYIP